MIITFKATMHKNTKPGFGGGLGFVSRGSVNTTASIPSTQNH